MADLQRARRPRAHHRLAAGADLTEITLAVLAETTASSGFYLWKAKNENRAKYAQKYMDKWAEKYGPEAAARIAEIVLKD